jgi:hypothetical protein
MPNQNEQLSITWDRQSGETAQQYYAFCVYWKLGAGRSIQKARLRDPEESRRPEPPLHRQDRRSGVAQCGTPLRAASRPVG